MVANIKWRVSLAAIVKDEENYIVDWLCYHLSIGVEHFFIYDNGSTDNLHDVLRKFINGGVVTLIYWPMKGGQIDAYNHAIKLTSGNVEWLGFLDIDEFLVMHSHENVYELLVSLDADQILIPWRNFPYSGHYAKPGGSTLESFFWAYRIPPGGVAQVKHFARPEMIENVTAHFSFVASDRTKLPNGESSRVSHAIENPTYAGAQINHYATRSYIENQTRLQKGQVSGSAHKQLDNFLPFTASLAEKMDYDDSIRKQISSFKRERSRWNQLSDYPHRFGLHQKRSVLKSFNNLVFYLAKSFGNYVAGSQNVKPLSDIPLVQTQMHGGKQDLGSALIGYRKPIIYFDVPNDSFLRSFMGSIHYGDFVRRFEYDCLVSSRDIAVFDTWEVNTRLSGLGLVSVIELEVQDSIMASLQWDGEPTMHSETLPLGRHCIIIYSTQSFGQGRSATIRLKGKAHIKEFLVGEVP